MGFILSLIYLLSTRLSFHEILQLSSDCLSIFCYSLCGESTGVATGMRIGISLEETNFDFAGLAREFD